MQLGGRIQGAIDVLTDIRTQYTPVTDALRDWGKAHRFAGSKDRSYIGNLVHDALRRASSVAWMMDADTPRALALGTLIHVWDADLEEIKTAFETHTHAPSALTEGELKLLNSPIKIDDAPDWIKADVPEWLWPSFSANFEGEAILEGQALTRRPPLDLRVNLGKIARTEALETLSDVHAQACTLSPTGVRIVAKAPLSRLPNVQIEPIFLTGGIEIQDQGSQIVSQLVGAKPGERVLDYCAGGGGKTLAMANDMNGEGQIYAYDVDKRRLAPIYARAQRAGIKNIDVIQPPYDNLRNLIGGMDRVLVDAPCSGTGTWRRKPDAKWRLSLDTLVQRTHEQAKVLEQAKLYVRAGGLLCYVTCSLLAEENEAQVYNFLEKNEDFELLSAGELWEDVFGVDGQKPWSADGCSLTLTPAATDTDGFFFAVMERSKEAQ